MATSLSKTEYKFYRSVSASEVMLCLLQENMQCFGLTVSILLCLVSSYCFQKPLKNHVLVLQVFFFSFSLQGTVLYVVAFRR